MKVKTEFNSPISNENLAFFAANLPFSSNSIDTMVVFQFAEDCVFHSNTKLYHGVVTVTPHFISLFKSKKQGKFKHFISFQFLYLKLVNIKKESSIVIRGDAFGSRYEDTQEVQITQCENMYLLSHVINRNITLMYPSLSIRKPNVRSNTAPLNIPIAPSQHIQFRYDSIAPVLCDKYSHQFVKEIDMRFACSNYIMPITGFPKQYDFDTIAESCSNLPYFSSFITNGDINENSPISALLTFLEKNSKHFKIVCLDRYEDLNLEPIAKYLYRNFKKCKVTCWRITNSTTKNFPMFLKALFKLEIKVKVLDFRGTFLDHFCLKKIFKGIDKNENFHSLEVLALDGKIEDKMYDSLIHLLNHSSFMKELCLTNLTKNMKLVATLIMNRKLPIEKLDLSGNLMSPKSQYGVIQAVQSSSTIYDVNISRSEFTSENLALLAKALVSNSAKKLRILRINKMNASTPIFSKDKAKKKISFILGSLIGENCEKLGGLELDYMKPKAEHLKSLTTFLKMLPNLYYLSLSGNFSHLDKGVGIHVAKLLEIQSIQTLILKGSDDKCLKKEIIPVLDALEQNRTLCKIDITNNSIGQNNLARFLEICCKHPTLNNVAFDGNGLYDPELLKEFLKTFPQRPQSAYIKFPIQSFRSLCEKYYKNGTDLEDEFINIKSDSQRKLMMNRSLTGNSRFLISSCLPQSIVDEMYRESFEIDDLEPMLNRNHYSLISEAFKIPLPFQNRNEKATKYKAIKKLEKADPSLNEYQMPFLYQYAEVSDYSPPNSSRINTQSTLTTTTSTLTNGHDPKQKKVKVNNNNHDDIYFVNLDKFSISSSEETESSDNKDSDYFNQSPKSSRRNTDNGTRSSKRSRFSESSTDERSSTNKSESSDSYEVVKRSAKMKRRNTDYSYKTNNKRKYKYNENTDESSDDEEDFRKSRKLNKRKNNKSTRSQAVHFEKKVVVRKRIDDSDNDGSEYDDDKYSKKKTQVTENKNNHRKSDYHDKYDRYDKFDRYHKNVSAAKSSNSKRNQKNRRKYDDTDDSSNDYSESFDLLKNKKQLNNTKSRLDVSKEFKQSRRKSDLKYDPYDNEKHGRINRKLVVSSSESDN
ncbi:hypothetical protein TRFO_11736 [Tritrichomonas foetus]|uniref:Leucine Rich Repeat family protein n=1 Tax=Tritrichomonas foetus TaxID=1144522 RepID=A0A1J4J5V3_9EUKA|nr:hypothetical protein TRFO_11736 [Tritrichomonas foetus]|eukprot:OHS93527.1 hypothetical protein TRFO_11736 [Tritrichomonas foetus]